MSSCARNVPTADQDIFRSLFFPTNDLEPDEPGALLCKSGGLDSYLYAPGSKPSDTSEATALKPSWHKKILAIAMWCGKLPPTPHLVG
jgi:hypothetical protein